MTSSEGHFKIIFYNLEVGKAFLIQNRKPKTLKENQIPFTLSSCVFLYGKDTLQKYKQSSKTEKNVCRSYGRQRVDLLTMQNPLTYLEKDKQSNRKTAKNRSRLFAMEAVQTPSEDLDARSHPGQGDAAPRATEHVLQGR